MSGQRPHTKTGIASLAPAFLITFGLLALARCDSGFVPEPASTESDPVEHVRRWYEEAIARTQEERLGKFSNAEIIAAMVAKYPPDWSQAVSIALPSQDDITRVTTLLGPGQPTTTHSHAALGVVRTISVDVNPNDEVVGSRLLEFVSPDSLTPGNFADYVQQWGDRDFGDLRMLISEYDIAYESKVCEMYTPGEGFKPVDLTLEEVPGMGKTAASIFCYVSDVDYNWVCVGGNEWFPEEVCVLESVDIEITCVEIPDGGGGDDGGGSGGRGGGSSRPQFALTCVSSITRGSEGTCQVSVSSTDPNVTADNFTYKWTSSTGATYTGSGSSGTVWKGTATETAEITVEVETEDFSKSQTVTVNARDGWGFPAVSLGAVTYENTGTLLGQYRPTVRMAKFGAPISGSGPWSGRFAVGSPVPFRKGTIQISDDYDNGGVRAYAGAKKTCSNSDSLQQSETYGSVNSFCATTDDMNTFAGQILDHEKGHHKSLNDCLEAAKGVEATADLEAMTGATKASLAKDLRDRWTRFYVDHLQPAMTWSPPPPGGVKFWHIRNRGASNQRWKKGKPRSLKHKKANCN